MNFVFLFFDPNIDWPCCSVCTSFFSPGHFTYTHHHFHSCIKGFGAAEFLQRGMEYLIFYYHICTPC